jgi:hypothetical protein
MILLDAGGCAGQVDHLVFLVRQAKPGAPNSQW